MISKTDSILITGATGLVGSHVVRRLLNAGYTRVRAMKRATSRMHLVHDIEDQIDWVEADVTDITSLDDSYDGVDVVIHTAAVVSYDPAKKELLNEINVTGTSNMVNVALDHGIKRFVHISSVAALGKDNTHIRSEATEWDHSEVTTDYAQSKYDSEKEVWRAHAEGLPVIILNPSFVIGEGNWDQSSTAIWEKIDKGIPYYPMGTNGYVDVNDVSEATHIALESHIVGQRYVISGATIPYQHAFQWIAESIGAKIPTRPLTPTVRAIAWRLDWLRSKLTGSPQLLTATSAYSTSLPTTYDNTKSIQELGIKYHDIQESIKRVGAEYLESKKSGVNHAIIK